MKLFAALVAVLFCAASGARASTSCEQTSQGQLCTSQVDFNQFATQAFAIQAEDQWCWAASISMVFRFYGHPVSQERIVSDVYGSAVDMPARAGVVMAQELNRTWQDDNGHAFHSEVTGVYDAQYGIFGLSNDQIISELDQGHPLVIGARTHAVVVTAIEYYRTALGPDVVSVGAFDPWPGVGARGLAQDEMTPAHLGGSLFFAATVRVTDVSGSAGTGGGVNGGTTPTPSPGFSEPPTEAAPPVGCSTGGAGASPVLAVLVALWIRRPRCGART